MKKNLRFLNRPVSPHLFIYNPQISSLGSIWHRISAIVLILIVVLLTLVIEVVMLNSYTSSYSIFFITSVVQLSSWPNLFLYKFILLFLAYHGMNGFRYIINDLNFLSNTSKFISSFNIIIVLIFLILTLNI
uniref:Succinate:cytochrome c oxidoreductase subunit 3 n=1 Tax=Caulacanthus okamurae TaxID=152008 RepID=A0A6H1U7A9_9FLOR|nr:succinate:cytochrome c oxidoreductase subunit 3 [Caulacanthus okamurae]QIZ74778.1 succinate:cytochrome c oxidoreductase subunit 3 [Caulacanthus okamurae]